MFTMSRQLAPASARVFSTLSQALTISSSRDVADKVKSASQPPWPEISMRSPMRRACLYWLRVRASSPYPGESKNSSLAIRGFLSSLIVGDCYCDCCAVKDARSVRALGVAAQIKDHYRSVGGALS